MIIRRSHVFLLAVMALCAASSTVAQDNRTGQPEGGSDQTGAPPVAGTTAGGEEGSPPSGEANPDTRPLTGAQHFTLGSFGTERSFLRTDLHFQQTVVTNLSGTPNSSGAEEAGFAGGDLQLQRIWRRASSSVVYNGGAALGESNSGRNSYYQSFGFGQSFAFRRLSLSFIDNGTYTPQSPFGYAGFGSGFGGYAGFGTVGLNPNLLPNQSILTTYGTVYMNTVAGQANYLINRRSSVNVGGSFGFLRSTQSGFLGSNQYSASIGYNYTISPKDTVGLTYGFQQFTYTTSGNSSFDTHSMQAAYGRRITGRLGLQLFGGAQIGDFGGQLGQRTSWTTSTGLTYAFRNATTSLSYTHSITGGAGILPGATSDVLTGSVSRALARTIMASLAAGYARNRNANPVAGSNAIFNSEYLQVGLGHPVSHQVTTYFSYNLLHQDAGTGLCAGTVCAFTQWQHAIGVGVQWSPRPILIGH